MARGFVGLAPAEVAGQVVPLRDIWGGEARKLEERLWNAHGGAEMVCLLRTALQPPSDISSVQSAIEFLARNAGAVSLAQICRVAGLSERQLRRRCLEETGVTPKQLARIARFRQVCCAIHSHPRPNWAKLAIDCGYYDQAHLIHDFQEFSAATPGSYLRQLAG